MNRNQISIAVLVSLVVATTDAWGSGQYELDRYSNPLPVKGNIVDAASNNIQLASPPIAILRRRAGNAFNAARPIVQAPVAVQPRGTTPARGGGQGAANGPNVANRATTMNEQIALRMERIGSFLKQCDKDGDGKIDADEAKDGTDKGMLDRIFSRMGKEPHYPVSIADIKRDYEAYYRAQAAGNTTLPAAIPAPATVPFDARQAREHQAAWAKHLAGPVEVTNSIGMKLVLIPSNRSLPCYRIGAFEVTQAEYERVMHKNPSWFAKTGEGRAKVAGIDTSRFPVENVSWSDAQDYCRALSALPEERKANRTYRLPTEAEWLFACRAGSGDEFHSGKSLSSTQANFDGSHPSGNAPAGPSLGRPAVVGSYAPNDFGLYDMHGNVSEFCGPQCVLRGGSWGHTGDGCGSSMMYASKPDQHGAFDGFRVFCQMSGELASDATTTAGPRRGWGGRRAGSPASPSAMANEETAQHIARTEDFLKRLDTNGDGKIDAAEASDPANKAMVERLFARTGKEPHYPVSIADIKRDLEAYYRKQAAGATPQQPNVTPVTQQLPSTQGK